MPERDVVVAKDGTVYPASCHPGVRRFFERRPEDAAKARYLICWPRTSCKGDQVHLTVTSAPIAPERQASLKREAGRFRVSGVITNQRSRKNRVIVRVIRNEPVPRARRHEAQFKNHLLFLSGRAAPFANFLNKHTTFTCELKGPQLLIRGIESAQELETIALEAGGLKFPWPFQTTRQHIDLFCHLNLKEQPPFLVPHDARDRLQLRLRTLDLLITNRHRLRKPADHLMTDRIGKIRQRIHNFTRRMGDGELERLLEDTGLLVALGKLNPELTSNPTPEPAMPALAAPAPAPAVVLPKNLEKVAAQVCAGAPDALIAMGPGMNLKKVKASIAALMEIEGWWDSLPEETQARAQKSSYQIRKALKLRS